MSPTPHARGPVAEPPRGGPAGRLAAERAVVSERIRAMEADMARLVAASANSNADDEHDPEGATVAFERSQLDALTERARAHLAEIDAATDRLRSGRYGICEVCHGPIGEARLEARPTARTCVEHAGAAHR